MPSKLKTNRIFGPATGAAMVHHAGGATENYGQPDAGYDRPAPPVQTKPGESFKALPMTHFGPSVLTPSKAIPASTGGASTIFRVPGQLR